MKDSPNIRHFFNYPSTSLSGFPDVRQTSLNKSIETDVLVPYYFLVILILLAEKVP